MDAICSVLTSLARRASITPASDAPGHVQSATLPTVMPELPEVETVTRSLLPLVGRRIVTAEFRCMRILRGGDPDQMAASLAGRRIASVKRYGKFIIAKMDDGGHL